MATPKKKGKALSSKTGGGFSMARVSTQGKKTTITPITKKARSCSVDKCKQYTKIPSQYSSLASKFVKIRANAPKQPTGKYTYSAKGKIPVMSYVDRVFAGEIAKGNNALRALQRATIAKNKAQMASNAKILQGIVDKYESFA